MHTISILYLWMLCILSFHGVLGVLGVRSTKQN